MKLAALNPVNAIGLTTLAMLAFAGNALLTRAAFQYTSIDAASFTLLRLLSGAIVLALLVKPMDSIRLAHGSWRASLALFVYAAAFSYAFVELATATGAMLGFGAIQLTMLGFAVINGERFTRLQVLGILISLSGLVALLLPGLETPSFIPALLMLVAGIGWSVYTLLGKGNTDPLLDTAGNFARAALIASALYLFVAADSNVDMHGVLYAFLSGAITSGVGYIIWYMALSYLTATTAASVQLTVPVLATIGGVLFFDEMVSLGMVLISAAILGGITLVIKYRH